jgi:uncharacterized membrane protein YfcA
MKIPSYFALGQLTPVNLGIGAAMIPLAIATNFLGVWMLKRVPHDAFYRIAYVLMLALGVMLVRSAVVDLGWF